MIAHPSHSGAFDGNFSIIWPVDKIGIHRVKTDRARNDAQRKLTFGKLFGKLPASVLNCRPAGLLTQSKAASACSAKEALLRANPFSKITQSCANAQLGSNKPNERKSGLNMI